VTGSPGIRDSSPCRNNASVWCTALRCPVRPEQSSASTVAVRTTVTGRSGSPSASRSASHFDRSYSLAKVGRSVIARSGTAPDRSPEAYSVLARHTLVNARARRANASTLAVPSRFTRVAVSASTVNAVTAARWAIAEICPGTTPANGSGSRRSPPVQRIRRLLSTADP